MVTHIHGRRTHPSVDLDSYPESTIRMVLDYGRIIQSAGHAARYVYGPLSVVLTDDHVLAVFERDEINDLETLDYDEMARHPHFNGRLKDRNIYDYEAQDVFENGVRFYQQHTWFYLGPVDGRLIKLVRNGNTLKTVYWVDECPRDWSGSDDVTDTYMRRRHQRKARQQSAQL